MKKLFVSRSFHVVLALGVIGFIIFTVVTVRGGQQVEYVTTTVEAGTVERLVSVSGIIEAEQSADLAFPSTGIVAAVSVKRGDIVAAGDVLISLESRSLAADRADALASRARAVATRNELLAGPQTEARAATAQSVAFKRTTLETIKATQADLVQNAYRTLVSSGLTAVTNKPNETAVAPTVSGTYTCDQTGTYTLETYGSAADSGYSFRLSGIETGTFAISTDQPTVFGTCGLRLLFDNESRYSNTTWTISIPNRESAQYTSNRNAYTLAQTQAASAIALAEQDLRLTEATSLSTNAPARSEAIVRANADINSADARIARVDAQIAERTILAPFAGTITNIDILPGETVTTAPVVTVLASGAFDLTARIPEIDIGKLELGQPVRATFDARTDEPLAGTISFISLQATEIDGVAYYEAIVSLADTPTWLRSGLNADIVIITSSLVGLKIPKRFISRNDDVDQVVIKTGDVLATTTVKVTLDGNDGFVAITGVAAGDIIVAP